MPLDLPNDPSIRRILIIKWSALGDLIMATSVMADIAQAFPKAQIDLNTLPPWHKLFQYDARFSNITYINVRQRKGKWQAMWQWMQTVRRGRYDLIIDLQTTDRSRFMLGLLRLTGGAARYLIGNNLRWPYHISAPDDFPNPAPVQRMRAGLNAAGIATTHPRPVLPISPHNQARALTFMQTHGLQENRYALFFPGCQAAGYLKRWGEEKYADLARTLLQGEVDHVVLIGGKDEIDDCRRITELVGQGVVNLCGETEILDIVPLANTAKFMFGNDTGTAHIASASSKQMVIICGPTDPYRVKPLGDNVVAVQAEMACMNCYCKHPCEHHSCMKAINTEHVMAMLQYHHAEVIMVKP
ncbi:MAG: glycosyltransferase family 9 protein [Sulfuriferula sp.]|nr:glycosyltransferase family 9 protein [Sulfuriferula sp.]